MPFPNFHSSRQVDPDEFEPDGMGKGVQFKTIKIGDGITAIVGKLKKPPEDSKAGSTHVQTYRFDKDKYTAEEAKAWLKKHNLRVVMFETAKNEQLLNEGDDMANEKEKNESVLVDSQSQVYDASQDFMMPIGTDMILMIKKGSLPDGTEVQADLLQSPFKISVNLKPEAKLKKPAELYVSNELISQAGVQDVLLYGENGQAVEPKIAGDGNRLYRITHFSNYYYIGSEAGAPKNVSAISSLAANVTNMYSGSSNAYKTAQATSTAITKGMNTGNDPPRLNLTESKNTIALNEDIQTGLLLEEISDATGKKLYKGKVRVAQKADTRNNNGRIYPEKVLSEAISELKSRLSKGPVPLYRGHRTNKDGKNENDLNEIIGLLHDVNFHPEDKTVSLDDIRFVETQAGKDVIALAEAQMPFQVSQRGMGKSHLVKHDNNIVSEIVDSLTIDGWDVLRDGRASVANADMEFQVLTEEAEMPDKNVLTEEEVDTKLNGFKDTILTEIKTLIKPGDKPEGTTEPKNETFVALTGIQKTINEQKERLDYLTKKEELEILTKTGTQVINEVLSTDTYKRFDAEQKKVLFESVSKHIPEMYGKVEFTNLAEVKTVITKELDEEVSTLDKYIAASKLQRTGYPKRGTGNGIQDVEVLNENLIDGELAAKLSGALNERLISRDGNRPFFTDPQSSVLAFMKQVEARHISDVYKSMNESGILNEATLVGTDVGPKIASVGISLIRNVFPRLSALQICSMGTMDKIQDIITVKAFSQAISANPYTNVLVLTPGEDTSLNTVKTTTTPYPIIATQKAVGGVITSLAQAIARGSGNIDPIADTLEDIARYFQTTINHLIWWSVICKAQAYAKTEVSSYTQLTIVPGSTYEFDSGHPGWIQFEWVKKLDSNGNPVYAMPLALFGTTSGDITYQPVVVREHGGDTTALVYGTGEDYTVNWADGTITLTAAGLAKCANDGTPEAKFSYTTNLKTWSITTPTGITGEDHLKNLGLAVGQAKSLVRNRDYEPTFIAMNYDNNDMIANSPIYTNAGNRAGNLLDSRGNMSQWIGLEVAGDRLIPSEWLIVGTQGKAIYKIHTPMSIKRVSVSGKTNDEIQVEQYDCQDSPEPQAFSLVGITDLNT